MKHPENGCTNDSTGWHYYLDGKEVTEAEYEAVYPPAESVAGVMFGGWTKPLLSDALAVHPSQVKEAEERNARRGCSVTYRADDGRAIIPDRGERKRLLKIEGLHDRSGGYGDG